MPNNNANDSETTQQLPPGPKGHPLIGSLPEMHKERVQFLLDLREEYGDVVWFKVAKNNICLVADPDDIVHVLGHNSANYHKSNQYKQLAKTLGPSVLITEDDQWKHQRRMMDPHFRRDILNGYAEMMVKTTTAMVDRWLAEVKPGETIDLMKEMSRLTLSIVCNALFGVDISTESAEAGQAFSLVLEFGSKRLQPASPEHLADMLNLPTEKRRQWLAAQETLNKIIDGLIAYRRKNGAKDDLLSGLVFAKDEQGGPAMSDEELRSQVLTLFLAGHETTATALTWTFTLLSQHPESERKLHEELVAAIGDRLPTVDDLPQMSYGQQVIDESLRIYPPIPMIARMALGDDTLGGYHIPAGTMVVLSPEVTHRHPDYWDNPEGFDPERFEPEAVKARPHFAYFPFGGGPRKCIGDNFAALELRLVVSTVVQRVRLELAAGHKVQAGALLTQRPEGVVNMTVHPR